MRHLVLVVALSLLWTGAAGASEAAKKAVVYKDPQCGCCDGHADYLRENGFEVTVKPTQDLRTLRLIGGVAEHFAGCHMTLIDGYVVEGHVPVEPINRLLSERPDIKGIALPGMPTGSPGMGGQKTEPFVVYEIAPGAPKVYSVE